MKFKPMNRPDLRQGPTHPARPNLAGGNKQDATKSKKIGGCSSCRGGRKK